MTTPESLEEIAANLEWQRWAAKGWTLQQAPGGWVLAIHADWHLATERARRLTTLVKRLRMGAFSHRKFALIKRRS
jgi:hypothetical protein